MSKYNQYRSNYIPTKQEKNQYLKEYFAAVFAAACVVTPFVIYFANMKP